MDAGLPVRGVAGCVGAPCLEVMKKAVSHTLDTISGNFAYAERHHGQHGRLSDGRSHLDFGYHPARHRKRVHP